jgi:hypothetical protein
MTDRPHATRPPSGRAQLRRRMPALASVGAVCVGLSACGRGGGAPAVITGVVTPQPIQVLAKLGDVGMSPGLFVYPRAIDHDASALWVIDKSARVQRIDPGSGRCLAIWTMPEFKNGKPCGLAVVPTGAEGGGTEDLLYIADTHYQRVMVYRPPHGMGEQPELIEQFGSFGRELGQFTYVTDVAVLMDASGRTPERIYVSEYGGNDRVSVFDGGPGHRPLFAFGHWGDGTDETADEVQFSRPQSLAIDAAKRELVVTDSCNHRVGRFTLDGKLVKWFGSAETAGDGPGRFRYPYGLHLMGDGTALVAEYGNNRVQRIDLENGDCLGLWGTTGRETGELAVPWSVTVLGDRVYVLDSGNNRVLGFAAPAKRAPARGAATAAGVATPSGGNG